MDIQQRHRDGVSVSEIARRLNLDRKTVRKYLRQVPRAYERKPKRWKVDPFRAYLRERWESGVVNSSRLFAELQKRGYAGGVTQVCRRTTRGAVQTSRQEPPGTLVMNNT
jgi:transposase